MQDQLPSSLDKLVSQVITASLPAAVKRRSFFINEITQGIPLLADRQLLASVINGATRLMTAETSYKCIRVMASVYGPVILITLKDKNGLVRYGSSHDVQPLQELAIQLGGSISTTYYPKLGSSIVISFSNAPKSTVSTITTTNPIIPIQSPDLCKK
jgi:hypothetical protein